MEVTAASCPVWLPWGLRGLPRLRTLAGIAQFLSFFSGEGGPGSWEEFQALSHPEPGWDFTRAQTLGAPSTCGVLVEIWAPSGSGMGAHPSWKFWARCHLVTARLSAGWGPGRAASAQPSPAQLSALYPVIAAPQGQSDPSSARAGHCTCVPTLCQCCSTVTGMS